MNKAGVRPPGSQAASHATDEEIAASLFGKPHRAYLSRANARYGGKQTFSRYALTMANRFPLLLASAILPLMVSCTSAERKPLATTVCELADAPSRYAGKQVQFTGHFRTDNHHVRAVFDPRCPTKRIDIVGLAEATIVPSGGSEGHQMVTTLKANPPFLPRGTGFRGTFAGTYRSEKLTSMWASDYGSLSVSEITGLLAEKDERQFSF